MARVSDNAQSKHVYSKHVEEISEGHAPEASEEEKEEKMNQGKSGLFHRNGPEWRQS